MFYVFIFIYFNWSVSLLKFLPFLLPFFKSICMWAGHCKRFTCTNSELSTQHMKALGLGPVNLFVCSSVWLGATVCACVWIAAQMVFRLSTQLLAHGVACQRTCINLNAAAQRAPPKNNPSSSTVAALDSDTAFDATPPCRSSSQVSDLEQPPTAADCTREARCATQYHDVCDHESHAHGRFCRRRDTIPWVDRMVDHFSWCMRRNGLRRGSLPLRGAETRGPR